MTYSIHSGDPNYGSRDWFKTLPGSWLIQCTPGIRIADTPGIQRLDPATYLIPWVRRFRPYRNSVLRFDLICQTFVLIIWCCVELSGHLIRKKMKTFISLGPSLIFTLGCSRSISRNSGLPADVIRHLPDWVHHKLFCTFQVGTNSIVF